MSHQARAGPRLRDGHRTADRLGAVVIIGLASETDTAQAVASNSPQRSASHRRRTPRKSSPSLEQARWVWRAKPTPASTGRASARDGGPGKRGGHGPADQPRRVRHRRAGQRDRRRAAHRGAAARGDRARVGDGHRAGNRHHRRRAPAPPAPTFQPGYRGSPRTARDLDPLPPGDDLAEQVRDKWDAIERANAAIKARAAATLQRRPRCPRLPSLHQRRGRPRSTGAIAAAGLPLTDEQLRADGRRSS